MNSIQRLADILTTKQRANNYAVQGIYHDNGTVTVNGVTRPCECASLDLRLTDGCIVYVMPSHDNYSMVIVGGGE